MELGTLERTTLLSVRPGNSNLAFIPLLLLGSLLLVSAVSPESLDMDEGFSVWLACHETFRSLWRSLTTGDSSDLHMGLYNVYLWLWVKLFGAGEYAIRAANIPFGVLLCWALGRNSRNWQQRPAAWLVLCLAPLIWYYMNEARAYLPMTACAAVSTSALLGYAFDTKSARKAEPYLCLGFLCLATAFHLTAVLLIPAFVVVALLSRETKDWRRDWSKPLTFFVPPAGALCAYHIWAHLQGTIYAYEKPVTGTGVTVYLPPSGATALYHFLGFTGFGPGRERFWVQPMWHAWIEYWPLLLAVLVTFALSAGLALSSPSPAASPMRARVMGVALLVTLICVVSVSMLSGHHVPSRHFLALLPLWLLLHLELIGRTGLTDRSSMQNLAALAIVAVLWIVSDMRLRFMPQYRKPAYREAVQVALQKAAESGGEIVWTGDLLTASYYGLRLTDASSHAHYAFKYEDGILRVPWRVKASGLAATGWTRERIRDYLSRQREKHKPIVVVRDRDRDDAWQTTLTEQQINPGVVVHGFEIYLIAAERSENVGHLSTFSK